MNLKEIELRIESLISKGEKVLETSWTGDFGIEYVNPAVNQGFLAAAQSFILNLYENNHPYYLQVEKYFKDSIHAVSARSTVEILRSVLDEVNTGWHRSFKKLVAAEIFTDFIEMAEYLLKEGYKDPAAVIIGGVLEEHLRQLCLENGVEVSFEKDGINFPKKADRMNSDLAKAGAYNILQQKTITAWLDLRNNSAHGKYDAYKFEDVKFFLLGLTDFINRTAG